MDLPRLRRALLADLAPEIDLALKVAVLQAAGYQASEIQRRLGASSPEMRKALKRVKGAADRLDAGRRRTSIAFLEAAEGDSRRR